MNITVTEHIKSEASDAIVFKFGSKGVVVPASNFEQSYNDHFYDNSQAQIYSNMGTASEGVAITELPLHTSGKVPYQGIIKHFNNNFFFLPKAPTCLHIKANHDNILHLPWEELNENAPIPIIKEVRKPGNNKARAFKAKKGILFATSSARDVSNSPAYWNLNDSIKSEVSTITNGVFDTKSSIEYIGIIRNLNIKSAIKTVPPPRYLHVICHGDKDGTICISDHKIFSQVFKIEPIRFCRLFKKEQFNLCYLALCHSGSGYKTQNSL